MMAAMSAEFGADQLRSLYRGVVTTTFALFAARSISECYCSIGVDTVVHAGISTAGDSCGPSGEKAFPFFIARSRELSTPEDEEWMLGLRDEMERLWLRLLGVERSELEIFDDASGDPPMQFIVSRRGNSLKLYVAANANLWAHRLQGHQTLDIIRTSKTK